MSSSSSGEPGVPGSMRIRAMSEIRTRIQHGGLSPDVTFSEVAMCEQLGMSRAPVREALITLAAGGWVEALPRAGWQVRPMTLNEARDLLAVRAALVPPAAATAARWASQHEDAVAGLVAFVADEEGLAGEALVVAGYRCLRRISRLSRNLEFDRSLEDVLGRLIRYQLLEPVLDAYRASPVPLGPAVEAVVAGDRDRARDLVTEYAVRDQARLTEAIIDSDLIRSLRITVAAPTRGGDDDVAAV